MTPGVMPCRLPSFLSALSLIALWPADAAPLAGVARVVDGDTIAFAARRVRIWGIDAPEARQSCQDRAGRDWPCGVRASEALARWLAGRPLACRERDRDHNGRPVASCTVAGQDVAQWAVRQGWAFDYARYSRGTYAGPERSARSARRNIWTGTVMPPWTWRAQHRRATAPPAPSPACPYKGNINAKGGHIVHAPGQRDYAAVRIDASRGERWFCSMAAARAAGWRPAAR